MLLGWIGSVSLPCGIAVTVKSSAEKGMISVSTASCRGATRCINEKTDPDARSRGVS